MKKVSKFTVSEQAFQDARRLPCFKIPYICTTKTEFPKQFDFIIINDKNGNEIVRNFMMAKENVLEYTSCFHGDKCDDISLTVNFVIMH